MVVCTGRTSSAMMRAWFRERDGLRRPYYVVTMDAAWFEAAAEFELPRFFFTDKLELMLFVRTHDIICLEACDKTDERQSMAASMYGMGALSIPIASDEEY